MKKEQISGGNSPTCLLLLGPGAVTIKFENIATWFVAQQAFVDLDGQNCCVIHSQEGNGIGVEGNPKPGLSDAC